MRPARARIIARTSALAMRVNDQKFTCISASALSWSIIDRERVVGLAGIVDEAEEGSSSASLGLAKASTAAWSARSSGAGLDAAAGMGGRQLLQPAPRASALDER